MRKINLLILLALFALVDAQGQDKAHNKKKKDKMEKTMKNVHLSDVQSKDTKEIEKALNAYYDSWSNLLNSPNGAGQYYSKDPGARFWDATYVEKDGWQAYSDAVEKSFMQYVESYRAEPTGNLEVIQSGNLFITIATMKGYSKMKDGSTDESFLRQTLVWAYQDDGWKIIHEHSSVPPTQG